MLDPNKTLEFYRKIKETEVELYKSGIESEFSDKDRSIFQDYREKWRRYVDTVERDIATVLVERLKQNEADFETGIKAINQEIQEINDTVAFLNLFERTIATLGRIVTFPI